MGINGNKQIRTSKELLDIINFIRARCILQGKETPTITEITIAIAKEIDKERLWQNEFSQ